MTAAGARPPDPEWVDRMQRIGVGVWTAVGIMALVGAAFWLVLHLWGILVPFVIALVVVYVLRPAVAWVEERRVPRIWAVVITFVVALVVVGAALGLLVPPVLAEMRSLIVNLPAYWERSVAFVGDIQGRLATTATGRAFLQWLASAPAQVSEAGASIAQALPGQAAAIGNVAFNLFLAPIIAFYVLADLPSMQRAAETFLPKDHQPEFMDIVQKVDVILAGYLRGQLVASLAVGLLTGVFFVVSWLLGHPIPYALALTVAAGVTNVVPYVGPWATALVAALVGLTISPLDALIAFGIIMGAQQIVATFISPKIISSAVNLHPALVIFALMVGGAVFGIMGVLLAIPVAAAAKAVFLHFYEKYVFTEETPQEGGPSLAG